MGVEGLEGWPGLGLDKVKNDRRPLTSSSCLGLSLNSKQKLGPQDSTQGLGAAGQPD